MAPSQSPHISGRHWIGISIGIFAVSLFVVFLAILFRIGMQSPQEISASTGEKFGSFLTEVYAPEREPGDNPCVRYLQSIEDSLATLAGMDSVLVCVGKNPTINAISLPGNRIIVYTGLLHDVESENEMTMILAHETGHLMSGHIQEAFGRRLALSIAASGAGRVPVLGPILIQLGNLGDLKFSRTAEAQADTLGLRLLYEYYGNVGGATSFFERRLADEEEGINLEFLNTHPLSRNRILAIRNLAEANGWQNGPLVDFNSDCWSDP